MFFTINKRKLVSFFMFFTIPEISCLGNDLVRDWKTGVSIMRQRGTSLWHFPQAGEIPWIPSIENQGLFNRSILIILILKISDTNLHIAITKSLSFFSSTHDFNFLKKESSWYIIFSIYIYIRYFIFLKKILRHFISISSSSGWSSLFYMNQNIKKKYAVELKLYQFLYECHHYTWFWLWMI